MLLTYNMPSLDSTNNNNIILSEFYCIIIVLYLNVYNYYCLSMDFILLSMHVLTLLFKLSIVVFTTYRAKRKNYDKFRINETCGNGNVD